MFSWMFIDTHANVISMSITSLKPSMNVPKFSSMAMKMIWMFYVIVRKHTLLANNLIRVCALFVGDEIIWHHWIFLAVDDFQKALTAHEGNRRAKEGLQRAQKLLKQSKKRDYYKILGVKR